jgi:hypothetical protein
LGRNCPRKKRKGQAVTEVLILRSVEQERKRSKLPFIGRKSVPKKGKEEKHQDELQDVQNFDDQETHQNNVCLEGLRRRWKRIRKVSAFLGVNQKQ